MYSLKFGLANWQPNSENWLENGQWLTVISSYLTISQIEHGYINMQLTQLYYAHTCMCICMHGLLCQMLCQMDR